jgi:hypothetical protein
MKSRSALLGLAIAFAAVAAQAQTNAVTDPVGYYTWTLPNGYNFVSPAMTQPVEYAGKVTSIAGTTITDTNAVWTAGAYSGVPYWVEFLNNGTNAGVFADVASNGTNSLVTATDLSSVVTVGTAYKLRKHWTIGTLFSSSFITPGGDASTADNLYLWNGGGYDIYYNDGSIWTDDGFEDRSNIPIYPDEGLIISRKVANTTNGVVVGHVKTGQTKHTVVNGFNFIGNIYPVGSPATNAVTLGNSGLAPNMEFGGDAGSSDNVYLWNGGGYDIYYYDSGSSIWTDDGFEDRGNIEIPLGGVALIKRLSATGFTWTQPQPYYAP